MNRTRKSLLLRIRDHKDNLSWEEFTRQYQPIIQRVAESQGLPRHEAADVVQEVFMVVMRTVGQFEYRELPGGFRCWLKTITRNKVIDWLRRHRTPSSLELERAMDHKSASGHDVHQIWDREEQRKLVCSALDHVRSTVGWKTWKCFEEHVLRRRKAKDIALELGTSENSVYINSTRVVGRIRERCRLVQEELAYAP